MNEWESKLETNCQDHFQRRCHQPFGRSIVDPAFVERILTLTGKDNIREVWPNLEVFMHGGVSFIPDVDQFKNIVGPNPLNYLQTYNASEGFFGNTGPQPCRRYAADARLWDLLRISPRRTARYALPNL